MARSRATAASWRRPSHSLAPPAVSDMKAPLSVVFVIAIAGSASAQTTPADIISFLVTNESVQTGDFQKDQTAAAATRDTIERALLVNLATTPIATSSSGFVYQLDSDLGTPERVSNSFGTFFVERAMTSGRGHVAIGAS